MISMTRSALNDLRKQNGKCLMITLTFRDLDVPGDYATEKLNKFWTRFKRKYDFKDYVVCREFQKRGTIHYHILIFDLVWLPFVEVSAMWGEGYIGLTAFDNDSRAINYAVKEISKGGLLHSSRHLLDKLFIRDYYKNIKALNKKLRYIDCLFSAVKCGVLALKDYFLLYDKYIIRDFALPGDFVSAGDYFND